MPPPPPELYGTVNALRADRIASALSLTAVPRAGRGFFACVACGSSDGTVTLTAAA